MLMKCHANFYRSLVCQLLISFDIYCICKTYNIDMKCRKQTSLFSMLWKSGVVLRSSRNCRPVISVLGRRQVGAFELSLKHFYEYVVHATGSLPSIVDRLLEYPILPTWFPLRYSLASSHLGEVLMCVRSALGNALPPLLAPSPKLDQAPLARHTVVRSGSG